MIEYSSGQFLYNVVLGDHSTMVANGMIAETLNPSIGIMSSFHNPPRCVTKECRSIECV